jgi:hypothetical protein
MICKGARHSRLVYSRGGAFPALVTTPARPCLPPALVTTPACARPHPRAYDS